MEIGNPIYDVAFKFMMEDLKVAKLMLGALTGLDILDLTFEPQEFTNINTDLKPSDEKEKSNLVKRIHLNIFRLDFTAKIKTKTGKTELIILEIQKSKIFATPLRFRNYLGKPYSNNNLYYIESIGTKKYKAGIPIKSIYFLGELFHNSMANVPVININLDITNQETGERLDLNDPFINSLYHTGIIVNIPALKEKAKNDLTALLNIFNDHILQIDETTIPEKYHPILNRLAMIAGDGTMLHQMEVEDDFLAELDQYLDTIDDLRSQKEEEQRQKEEEQRQKEEVHRQKEEERSQKEEERRQKEVALNRNKNTIKYFVAQGMNKDEICEILSMTLAELEELIK